MTTNKAPEDLLQQIRRGNRFLLTSHVSPDGDAVGSCLGLARLLRGMGKGAVVWLRDEPPAVYHALPGASRIHVGAEPPTGYPEKFDGVVALECPGLDRCGVEDALGDLPVINVDHHLGNQHYGAVNWVDPAAPAVGEMVFRLAQALKVPVDADTANCLYLTLVTDTGGFRFANATAAAFEAAAALVEEGARPDLVAKWLYESQPEATLRLLAEMLTSLELHADGRVATALLTREMYDRAGADHGHAEGLIDHPRSIAGVDAVALVRELEEGGCKVSLRSRGDVDVEQIARLRDGGGHKNAAGYKSDDDVETVLADATSALEDALHAAEETADEPEAEEPAETAETEETAEATEAS